LTEQINALERGKTLAAKELAGLGEQAGRIESQLEARRQTSAGLESLQVKGYIPVERGLEQKIKILDLEEKSINVGVATARVQTFAAGLERDIINVEKGRKSEVDAEILKLERDLAQARIELGDIEQKWSIAGNSPQSEKRISYRITRSQTGSGVSTTTAFEDTSLRPGDVLDVSVQSAPATE
jgi:hypothetical protein